MDEGKEAKEEEIVRALRQYATIAGLGYSEERISELFSKIREQLLELSNLWQINTGDSEMAITFSASQDSGDE